MSHWKGLVNPKIWKNSSCDGGFGLVVIFQTMQWQNIDSEVKNVFLMKFDPFKNGMWLKIISFIIQFMITCMIRIIKNKTCE